MIESEEKRKKLTQIIDRWVEKKKVKQYLRDYDVPSLVDSILTEWYKIHLTCGHLVKSLDDHIYLEIQEEENIRCGCYCYDCAKSMLKNDNVKICNKYAAEAHDG